MIPMLYEPFKHWSDGGSVWILSDTHFDDADCKLIDKNWINPIEQVNIINSKARKADTLVLLGDVGDPIYVPMIKAKKKILILGNHDKRKDYEDLFSEIYAGPVLIAEKILLSHEPVPGLAWCLNIHGHDHWNVERHNENHINLAANVCGYTPMNLKDIISAGYVSNIPSIHRITINKATERKINKQLK